MANKAYIVANKQQEQEVLDKLYIDGMTWCGGEEATQIIPSDCYFGAFPYVIFVGEWLSWNKVSTLEDEEIVYDGRNEEQMSEKYVVPQEFMNELEWWETYWNVALGEYVDNETMLDLFNRTKSWWVNYKNSNEQNNRLIAIIRWVNGEDVFEVEKPKKWVVRSKEHDEGGNYQYVKVGNFDMVFNKYNIDQSTRFDTKEEAESWANSHQLVIEVEE